MKNLKLLLSIALIALFALFHPTGWLPGGNSPYDVVKAEDGAELQEPKLVIGRSAAIPAFKAGEDSTLNVPIENIHQGTAKNLNASLVVDDQEKFPFQIENMSLQTGVVSIGSRQTEMARFAGLKVSSGAESKVYPVTVKVDYTSETGIEGSATGTIFVKIINSQAPVLRVTDLQPGDESLLSGDNAEIKLQIKNDGGLVAKDIDVKLSGFTATGLRLDQPLDTFHIQAMQGGEFKILPFKVVVDPGIESGSYPLDVTMKYKNESNKEYSVESKVYVAVEGKSGDGRTIKSSPRLIVEYYDYGTDYIRPGEAFNLNLVFLNTSPAKDIYNLKVSLTSDDNIFSPINSGSSFVADEITAGSSLSRLITLKSKMDAASKTYNITANLDYEDQKGNKYTDKEIIGIEVVQEGKLLAPILDIPDEVFNGSPFALSVTYCNTGKAPIKNLLIHTQGEFEIKDGDEYVGTLDSGKSDYFEVTLTPGKEGICTGTILFSFNDETGQSIEVIKEFQVEVRTPEEPAMVQMQDSVPPKTGANWFIILGGGALALLVVIFLIIRNRRRKQREEMIFDE